MICADSRYASVGECFAKCVSVVDGLDGRVTLYACAQSLIV